MSFAHCHGCGWSQDDFWSESYNPITFLEKNYTKELLTADLDEVIHLDRWLIQEQGIPVALGADGPTRRELIAWQLEKQAQRIRTMVFRTEEELMEENPKRRCPKCGQGLCID